MYHDLVLNLGPLLCYAYITFFSKIRNIDNYQSICVKLKFPLKDIIFYNTSLLWKKWDKLRWNELNFILYGTGTSQHFLRSNYLEMRYFHVCLYICETQVYSCRTGSAISGIPHPKFLKSFVTDTFFHFF